MLIVAMLAGTAEAGGVLVGASAGPALPLQLDTDSPKGMSIAGFVGYRAGLGPLHLRPDVMYRHNTASRTNAFGVGGAVTFGAPVAFGPYAHLGLGFGEGRSGAVGDAGVLAEVGLPGPLYVALNAGWESAGDVSEVAGLRLATNWFVARANVGLSF